MQDRLGNYRGFQAYKDISCADAARMLYISPGETEAYWTSKGWEVAKGRLSFRQDSAQDDTSVPSVELANMAITYAREMEQIV